MIYFPISTGYKSHGNLIFVCVCVGALVLVSNNLEHQKK